LRNLDTAGGLQRELKILELLISSARRGDVFLDVGANVGLYSLLLASALGSSGQVIAFEPERESFEHLQDNLKLNEAGNVRPFQKALGDADGRADLFLRGGNADSTFVWSPSLRYAGQQMVHVVQGDGFLERQNLPLPRLVKVDVEGYECNVLRGLRRTLANPRCELVCCEVHPGLLPKSAQPEDIVQFLSSIGFDRTESFPRYDTFHLVARKMDPSR
jgi:FkbM family methyltransferase